METKFCGRHNYWCHEIGEVMIENMDCDGNCDECKDMGGD